MKKIFPVIVLLITSLSFSQNPLKLIDGVKIENSISVNTNNYKIIEANFDFTSIPTDYDNSTWVIVENHDLGGNTIILPFNVTLNFQGGGFRNGNIVGNNTKINSNLNKIFNNNSLSGTWNVKEIYPQWFGALGNGINDDASAIQKSIDLANISQSKKVVISKGNYKINQSIILKNKVQVHGYGVDETNLIWGGVDRGTMVKAETQVYYITFEDIGLIGNNSNGRSIGADIGFDASFVRDSYISKIQVKAVNYINFDIRSGRGGSHFDTPCIHNTFNQCSTYSSKSGSKISVKTHAQLGNPFINNGVITSIPILVNGLDYSETPFVTIIGNGKGATAKAIIDENGKVITINITNGGSGYSNAHAFVTTYNFNQPTISKYGFRIREEANANTFINCKTNGSFYGFSEEGSEEFHNDNSKYIANQNTFIGCNAEPAFIGFQIKSKLNSHYGSRAEQCAIPIYIGQSWDNNSKPSGNIFNGVTVFGIKTYLEPPYIYGLKGGAKLKGSSFTNIGGTGFFGEGDIAANEYMRLPVRKATTRPNTSYLEGFNGSNRKGLVYFDEDIGIPLFNDGGNWVDSERNKYDEIFKSSIAKYPGGIIEHTTARYTNRFIELRDTGKGDFITIVNIDRKAIYNGRKMKFRIVKDASIAPTLLIKDKKTVDGTCSINKGSSTIFSLKGAEITVGDFVKIVGANEGGTDLYAKVIKHNSATNYEIDKIASLTVENNLISPYLYYLNSVDFEDNCIEFLYTGKRWILWNN